MGVYEGEHVAIKPSSNYKGTSQIEVELCNAK